MFNNLTTRLQSAYKKLTGQHKITEENISEVLQEVRRSLIEADVALPVVNSFVARVKERALGAEVHVKLNAQQVFLEILQQVLVETMGTTAEPLNLRTQPPAVILMAGLQGAGKTTSVAKLAKLLKSQKKKVLVVSADVYRPAAIQQLQVLALEIGVDFYPSSVEQNPVDIVRNAKDAARKAYYDVLIVDTAGRLHVDQAMMDEIKNIHAAVQPIETLFTVDAMTGQDAANTARAFDQALPLTGVILTKLDGDTRGGAALSIREITGKPIKFFGTGEKTDALEVFHPDRIASRILDLGDVLSLIEKIKNTISKEEQEKVLKKAKSNKNFDFYDLIEQFDQMQKLGGSSLLNYIPGMSQLKNMIPDGFEENHTKKVRAIFNSMTDKERRDPKLLKHSRKLRIAAGSGQPVQEINKVLNQLDMFNRMKKQMGNPMQMARQLQSMLKMGNFMK